MTCSAHELLETIRRELAHDQDENRLVPLIASGEAPVEVIAALAGEQYRVIGSDWRSFLALASRSAEPVAREFFTGLAQGESLSLANVETLAGAAGWDKDALRGYRTQPGCQAYPAYQAWLALNGEPTNVVLALVVNFAAWGGYCATVANALRAHYGFDDAGCAFFDFFATPSTDMEEQALAIVQSGLDAGQLMDDAHEYARLLQGYELMFWNTLAGLV